MGRATVLVLLGLLIGGVFVAGILAVADDGEPTSPGAPTDAAALLCVDLAGDASARSNSDELRHLATAAVADAVAELSTHRYWSLTPDLSLSAARAAIDPDCPGEPKMECPEDPLMPPIGCVGYRVSEPSEYSLFVFIVSEADIEVVTLGLPERRSTLEVMCGGDLCTEVTGATWVSEAELSDPEEMYALIAEGLGLIKPRKS